MEELLVIIAKGLVEDKDAVTVTADEPDQEGVIVYHLHVAADDMGRVIGKQGRIAKALRTIAKMCIRDRFQAVYWHNSHLIFFLHLLGKFLRRWGIGIFTV